MVWNKADLLLMLCVRDQVIKERHLIKPTVLPGGKLTN